MPADCRATTVCHPREGDPSFRSMPDAVKEEIRSGWRREAEQEARIEARRQRMRRRTLIEALLLIGIVELLLNGLTPPMHLVGALALAVLVGEAWWRLDAGQVASPLLATIPWLLLQALWFVLGSGHVIAVLFGLPLIALSASYLGLRREQLLCE